MNKMGNKIGNEGVMKLLASLPSTSRTLLPNSFKACPPTPPHSHEMAPTVCLSLSSPMSLLVSVLLFHFPSPRLSFYLSAPPPTCVCQSHSFSLLSDRQWSMGKLYAVKTTAGERGAVKCRELRLKKLRSWGWVTDLRALHCNKREYLDLRSKGWILQAEHELRALQEKR